MESQKGTGFEPPLQAPEHWPRDVSYLNIRGTFYYLGSVLDGGSRTLRPGEIREALAADVEIVLPRARAKYPDVRPRIISDNGPQFSAKDGKEFIGSAG